MTCIRCQRHDNDYFIVTIEGAKKRVSVGLCEDCTSDFKDWIAVVPEGYIKQVEQLERMAVGAGR